MNVKRTVIGLCFALGAAAMPSAFARVDVAVGVGIGVPPPAPVVEYAPPPRYGYVWAPGYWAWRHDRHVWVRGHWIVARPGYYWVSDRWVGRGRTGVTSAGTGRAMVTTGTTTGTPTATSV
jgi:hypothetical protein